MPDKFLLPVDDVRLPRGRLKHVVDAADADRQAQQVAQELHNAAIEPRQISVSATIAWRSHALVTVSSNSTSLSCTAGEKASSSTARALCVCW